MGKDIDKKIREIVEEGFEHCALPPNAKQVHMEKRFRRILEHYDNLMDTRFLDREKYKEWLETAREKALGYLDRELKAGYTREDAEVCQYRADLLFFKWLQGQEGIHKAKPMKWQGRDAKQLAKFFVLLEKAGYIDRAEASSIYSAFDLDVTYNSFRQYVRHWRIELPKPDSPDFLEKDDNKIQIIIGKNRHLNR